MQVFAVDDCSVQLTWPGSPEDGLRVEVGGMVAQPEPSPRAELVLGVVGVLAGAGQAPPPRRVRQRIVYRHWAGRRLLDPAWPAGPGSVLVEGLDPGTTYDIVVSAGGVPTFLAGQVRTLVPPGGALLSRFATVSDLHIGEKIFGVLGRIHDPEELPVTAGTEGAGPEAVETVRPGSGTYPVRALRAAMDEAAAWGAELLVAKGDLTRFTVPAEVRDAGRLLAASPVPVEAILGNHDNQWGVNARAVLESEGVKISWRPRAHDLPGIRLVLMSTATGDPRYHRGQLSPEVSRQMAALAQEATSQAWVALHHPPDRHRLPYVYPPGVPYGEGRQLLDALGKAKRETFVTCGHRHRNRRYDYGPIVITEVGSTKDYPGVWAGYKVYEAGIMQVVRRTSRPDVMSWTEATRRAANGQWGRWSPGRLEDRCFTVNWHERAAHS
jgi:3',5'-cyclic-AMP phosphodiesterase